MGGVKPFILAACDTTYYETYGQALYRSARAAGHDCEVFCSGEQVTDWDSKIRHAHLRYQILPDRLQSGPVLMLDADSIIRKPAIVSDGCELGLVILDMDDYYRQVNGGCVYITPELMPLALKLKERINSQHWFDDQISLFRLCVKRGNYRTQTFDDSFFSWKMNPEAPIWTGKHKAKFRGDFLSELRKWGTA